MMRTKQLWPELGEDRYAKWRIVGVVTKPAADPENDVTEIESFFEAVPRNMDAHIAGLEATWTRLCMHDLGPDCLPGNKKRSLLKEGEVNVEGVGKVQIYEFKQGRLRVFYFKDECRVVVCTNGNIKDGQKVDPKSLNQAKNLCVRYFQDKGEGNEPEASGKPDR